MQTETNNNIIKVLLKSIGGAALIFILINFISFVILAIQKNSTDTFTFKFAHGSFFYNGETYGPIFGSSTGSFVLFTAFCVLLFLQLRKQPAQNN